MPTDDELDAIAARTAEMMRDKKYNGEIGDKHKVSFFARVTLGEILTMLAMLGGVFTLYISFHDKQIGFDNRLTRVEDTVKTFSETTKSLAENQSQLIKTQDRLTWVIEQQVKKP